MGADKNPSRRSPQLRSSRALSLSRDIEARSMSKTETKETKKTIAKKDRRSASRAPSAGQPRQAGPSQNSQHSRSPSHSDRDGSDSASGTSHARSTRSGHSSRSTASKSDHSDMLTKLLAGQAQMSQNMQEMNNNFASSLCSFAKELNANVEGRCQVLQANIDEIQQSVTSSNTALAARLDAVEARQAVSVAAPRTAEEQRPTEGLRPRDGTDPCKFWVKGFPRPMRALFLKSHFNSILSLLPSDISSKLKAHTHNGKNYYFVTAEAEEFARRALRVLRDSDISCVDPRGGEAMPLRAVPDTPVWIRTLRRAASRMYPGIKAALTARGLLGSGSACSIGVAGPQVCLHYESNGAPDMSVLFDLSLDEHVITAAPREPECVALGLDMVEMRRLALLAEDAS